MSPIEKYSEKDKSYNNGKQSINNLFSTISNTGNSHMIDKSIYDYHKKYKTFAVDFLSDTQTNKSKETNRNVSFDVKINKNP